MSKLVPPHGGKGLVCCLLEGAALEEELKKAAGLKQIEISSRAKGDLIMMGIGGFSPLNGFMNKADWKSVCEKMLLSDGTFWPVPVTLDVSADDAKALKVGEEVALVRKGQIMATMKVEDIYEMTEADKKWECELVFKGCGPDSEKFWEVAPTDHPGVKMVLGQKEYNIGGPVKVLSQGEFPEKFPGVYMTPAQLRAKMDERGWKNVAALQLRNPMHRSHEYLAKLGVEGKRLLCEPMKIDWTFYCKKCDGMASMRTCPHSKEDRVILSGTKLRKMLSEGAEVPDHFGREEVLAILREYYGGLTEKVEIKMQRAASGSTM